MEYGRWRGRSGREYGRSVHGVRGRMVMGEIRRGRNGSRMRRRRGVRWHSRDTGCCSLRRSMMGAVWKTRGWVVGRLEHGRSVQEVRGKVSEMRC